MNRTAFALTLAIAPALLACSQRADTAFDRSGEWQVDSAASRINFVTTKAGTVSELGTISGLTGGIDEAGNVTIEFPLETVDTGIETRDGRMKEFLFDTAQFPLGKVTAQLDAKTLDGLASGGGGSLEVAGSVTLAGKSAQVALPLSVATVGKDRVVVQSSKPVLVEASTFGLDGGIEKLRELANLEVIAPVVPVTVAVTFARK